MYQIAKAQDRFVPEDGLPPITIDNGRLYVGDEHVPSARFSANHVDWVSRADGRFSSGLVYFDATGASKYAVLAHGATSDDARVHVATSMRKEPASALTASHRAPAETPTPASGSLSLLELVTLVPDASVTETTQMLFNEGMKWAMGESEQTKIWLEEILGEKAPAIDDEHTNIVRQSLSWYQNVVARGQITRNLQSYKGPNEPSVRLAEEQALFVSNYFKPSDSLTQTLGRELPVLGTSPHYALQNKKLYMKAYRDSRPRLVLYIHDGIDWAERLQSWLEQPKQLDPLVEHTTSQLGLPGAMSVLNNWTTLLAALQPSGERAEELHTRVLQAIHANVIATLAAEVEKFDPETIGQWLPDALQSILTQIATGAVKSPGISQQQAAEALDVYMKEGASITAAMSEVLLAVKAADLYKQSQGVAFAFQKNFVVNWPKLAFLTNILIPLTIVGSVASVVLLLTRVGWEKLSQRERAEVVVQLAQNVVSLPLAWEATTTIGQLINWKLIDPWRRNGQSGLINQSALGRLAEKQAAAENFADQLIEFGQMERRGERLVLIPREGEPAVKVPRGFNRIFEEGKIAGCVKLAGVALVWVTCGLSAWKLAEDVENHASQETIGLDAAGLAAGVLTALFLTADLVVATAVLPFLSAFFAVAGVAFAIAEAFLPKKNPLDEFMRKFGVPFARGLDESGVTRWVLQGKEQWRVSYLGGGDEFTLTDREEERQLMGGDAASGNVYHGDGKKQDLARWKVRTSNASGPAAVKEYELYSVSYNPALCLTLPDRTDGNVWLRQPNGSRNALWRFRPIVPAHEVPAQKFPVDGAIYRIENIAHPGKVLRGQDGHVHESELPDMNEATLDLDPKCRLHSLQIRDKPGYGLVNLRVFESRGGRLVMPTRSFQSPDDGDGWFAPDHEGKIITVRQDDGGWIDGIQFAKHHNYGLVNMRVHREGRSEWDPWLAGTEADGRSHTERNVECLTEPRVVNRILRIGTWRRDRHGLTDAMFAYDSRLE